MEMIAVLAVLGIVAFVIVTRMTDTHASVIAEGDILKAHLRYAQALAMGNNTASWGVNVAAGAYTLLRDGAAAPVALPNETSASHTLPANVVVTEGTGLLAFDEQGSPGAVDRFITVSDGVQSVRLAVTRNTGLIP